MYFSNLGEIFQLGFDYVYSNVDYISWVLWVIYPIIISFILPAVILIFIYLSVLILFIYEQRANLRNAHDIWDGAKRAICIMWSAQARIWHGHEVEGIENIPTSKPALIIYYHGVIPVDFYYIIAKCFLERGRAIHAVGDKFLFHIPGWRKLLELFNVTPGTISSCVEVLKNGHMLAISPGGLREALFSDENYKMMWQNRTGFAKVAIQANVPIIPMFTVNCREAFRTPKWARDWLRGLYEKTRLPIVPAYGFFPVKLRTIFGSPIFPDEYSTPESLAKQTMKSLEELIKNNQRLPGNITRALIERFGFKR